MAQKLVDDEIKKPVAVFSKSYCPFCKMAKDALNDAGAKYEAIELDQRGTHVPDNRGTMYGCFGRYVARDYCMHVLDGAQPVPCA